MNRRLFAALAWAWVVAALGAYLLQFEPVIAHVFRLS